MISATNVNVAFQTIDVTEIISETETTPHNRAMNAPVHAVVPIDIFRGCQITKSNVKTKMIKAMNVIEETFLNNYLKNNHNIRAIIKKDKPFHLFHLFNRMCN